MELNNQAELLLHRLSAGVQPVRGLTPVNLDGEREKWLKNHRYSPVFEYPKREFDEKLVVRLRKLRFDDSFNGLILKAKRNETIKKVELLQAVGREDFSDKSALIFPWPDQETVKAAKKDLKKADPKTRKGPFFDALRLKDIFRWRFNQYGLDWEVRMVDFPGARLSVNKKNTLKIGQRTKFSLERTLAAVVHEIDTHVLRTENGKSQPWGVFQTGFPGYTITEEGLAVYNVSRLGLNILKIFVPQIRVIALDVARYTSFVQTAKTVLEMGLTPRQTWNLVWRLKRGLRDTSQPGAFTKDGSYFIGCRQVAEYLGKGKIDDLYVGKIGLEHLELISRLPGLEKPRFLPLPISREDLLKFA